MNKSQRFMAVMIILMLLLLLKTAERNSFQQQTALVADAKGLGEINTLYKYGGEETLQGLKKEGLTGVALWPYTLRQLAAEDKLSLYSPEKLCRMPWLTENIGKEAAQKLRGAKLAAEIYDPWCSSWLKERLTVLDIDWEQLSTEGDWLILREGVSVDRLLGYDERWAAMCRRAGLYLCPVICGRVDAVIERDLISMEETTFGWLLWSEGGKRLTDLAMRGERTLILTEREDQIGNRVSLHRGLLSAVPRQLRCTRWRGDIESAVSGVRLRGCSMIWMEAEQFCRRKSLRELTSALSREGVRTAHSEGMEDAGLTICGERFLQLGCWLTAVIGGCAAAWRMVQRRGGVIELWLMAMQTGMASYLWVCHGSFYLGSSLVRGVKAAQLIPIAVYAAGCCWRDRRSFRRDCQTWLNTPLTGKGLVQVLAGGMAMLGGAAVFCYYIHRTGNSSLLLPFERELRSLLEQLLPVRPRTKEYLIGIPCLMLWGSRRWRGWKESLLGVGGMIGLVSVINTWLHIQTPGDLHLLRTVTGLLLGGAVGAALLYIHDGRRREWKINENFKTRGGQ